MRTMPDRDKKSAKAQSAVRSGPSTQLIVIIGLLIIIALVIIFGSLMVLTLQKQNSASQDVIPISGGAVAQNGTGSQVKTGSGETQAIGSAEGKVQPGSFQMSMNTIWDFENASKPSSQAYVGNPENNTFPISVEVTIDDTGEVVYTSPVVPVGTQIKEIKLDKSVEAGEYPATCAYSLIDEDGNYAGGFSVAITIVVRN